MCVSYLAVARENRVIESFIKLGGKPNAKLCCGRNRVVVWGLLYALHSRGRRIFLFCLGFEATEVLFENGVDSEVALSSLLLRITSKDSCPY